MANEDLAAGDQTTTTSKYTTIRNLNSAYPDPRDNNSYTPTNTVAAITVAILAVIIVLTIVLVARAIRKRRRARRGTRMDQQIPTISTGIMGTPAAAYSNLNRPVASSPVRWEPINANPSTAEATSAESIQMTETT